MSRNWMRKYLVPTGIALLWLFGLGTQDAEAYIDPGTGSSLFSSLGIMLGVVATSLAIGLTQARRCGEWLLAKLASRRHAEQAPPGENPER